MPEVGVDGPWLSRVPQLARSIEGAGGAVVGCEVEKSVGQLRCVLVEGVDALAGPDIPDLGRGVEGARDYSIA